VRELAVSTMAGIAAEALEMLGVRSEVGDSGIDNPACTLHQPVQARISAGSARSFENEPRPLLDQILELATAQRRLRFGLAVEATLSRILSARRQRPS
jgi:hypothetical protein